MSISLLIILILAEMLNVNSAPKLGHVLFDPLSYEACNHDEKVRLFRRKMYKEIIDPESETLKENSSDDDFLENEDYLENKTKSIIVDEFENTSPRIQNSSDENDNETKINNRTGGEYENNESTTLAEKQNITNSDSGDIINPTTTQANDELSKASNLPKLLLRNKEVYDSVKKSGYDYDMQICKLINGRIMCGYNKNTGTVESNVQIIEMSNGCRIRGDRIECGYENGPSNNSPRQRLKGVDNKIINMLKDKKNQESPYDTVLRLGQDFKSISSLLCTECKATTHKVEKKAEVNTISSSEINTKLSTETNTTPSTEILKTPTAETTSTTATTKKEESTTKEKAGTTILRSTETSTSTSEALSSPEAETKIVKTLNQIFRKSLEQKPTDQIEERVEKTVTRCVEKGERIVCYNYKIKDTTKPLEATL